MEQSRKEKTPQKGRNNAVIVEWVDLHPVQTKEGLEYMGKADREAYEAKELAKDKYIDMAIEVVDVTGDGLLWIGKTTGTVIYWAGVGLGYAVVGVVLFVAAIIQGLFSPGKGKVSFDDWKDSGTNDSGTKGQTNITDNHGTINVNNHFHK